MTTTNWTGKAGTSDFDTASNWDNGVPTATLDASILGTSDAPFTVTHASGVDVVASLTSAFATITISGGSLTIASTASLGGLLQQTDGALAFDGAATLSGTFAQTGGVVSVGAVATLVASGTIQFGPNGTGNVDGPGTLATTGTTSIDESVYLGGGLDWSNSGTIADVEDIFGGDTSGASATITNLPGASFNVMGDNVRIDDNQYSTATGSATGNLTFVNRGVLAKTTGSNTSNIVVPLINTGTILSDSGVLELDGGGSFGGTIEGTSFVDFGAGNSTVDTFLTATNAFEQTGGVISVANGATLLLKGAAYFGRYGSGDVDGRGTLSTTGTTTISENVYVGGGLDWINSGKIDDDGNIYGGDTSGANATITNLPGASFDVTGDYVRIDDNQYSTATGSATGNLTFVNQGVLAKTGGSNTSNIVVPLIDTGTILSDSGVLELDGGGSFGGALGGTSFVDFGAGISTVDTILTATSVFEQTGGVISVAHGATMVLAGTAEFGRYGTGNVDGPGTLSTTGTTTVEESVYIGGGLDWNNSSTIDDDASIYGGDTSGASATITNAPGASFNITGDYVQIDENAYSTGTGSTTGSLTIVNQGILAKTSGSNTSNISVALIDTGTIVSDSGVLELEGGGSFGGTIGGTGIVDFGGGTSTVSYTLTATDVFAQDGGVMAVGAGAQLVLQGTAQFGPFGNAEVDGPGTLSSSGTTTISEDLYLGGGLDWSNSGTVDDGGYVYSDATAPGATITNLPGASFYLTQSYGGYGASSNSGPTFVNQGTLAKTGGVGVTSIFAPVMNTGIMSVQTGTLELEGPIDNEGIIQVGSKDALAITGVLSGSGSIVVGAGAFVEIGDAAGNDILFTGAGTLELDSPVDFAGTISGLAAGNEIILGGEEAVSATLSGSSATIDLADGTALHLSMGALPVNDILSLSDNVLTVAPFTLSLLNGTVGTIDWSSLEASLRSPSIDAADWKLIWQRFVDQVGTTTTSLYLALANDDATLTTIDQPNHLVSGLLSYELEQASGVLPNVTLTAATDLADNGGGLDLSLTRTYSASLLNRNDAGPFGDGWTFTYGITAVTDASDNVYITSPAGTEFFTLQADGSYAAQPGDSSTLTRSSGAFVLTDSSGTVERFLPDGQLGSVTDTNGNAITVSYNSSGVIAGVTSSNGQALTFTTNALGHITEAADKTGQKIAYTYDASGDHLLSVSGPDGVTSYTYDSNGNVLAENALTQITAPGGATETFTYDSEGSLASQSGSGGAGKITYTYGNAGPVTETDAAGNATALVFDPNGNLAATTDALGNVTQYGYDSAGQLTSVTTPTGGTYSYAYDADGNVTAYVDPNGGTVSATYAPGTDLLTSFTDQDGNTTDYAYNAGGNLTGITYDDGSGTTYKYSSTGLLTSSTDARDQTTTYEYDARGLLTRETFSDGTFQAYGYNGAGELTTAEATDGGVTTYGYNAAGELTSVTNPGGKTETYTYDTAGQEQTRTEPDGSETKYSYNAAGELTKLQDGSANLITQYTYNAQGQLTGSLDGNGQTTSYAYDADGNITQIVTKAADATLTSELDYTYNADGQPASVKSLDGTWTYTYDADEQLTHAVFASTNPSIADQDLTYTYDAAGNRTQTIFNGAVENYTTNGLNQYTASDGTTYSYDADGNLVSMIQNGATTTYTYNSQNQLTEVQGPSGTFTYGYDALGNMVSSSDNGVVSSYVIDPLAISTSATGPLSAIAQAYSAAGSVTATYEYGGGLVAVTEGGNDYYYDSDANGNITSVSGEDGVLVDYYDYSPSGALIYSESNVGNIFQYEGAIGAATDGAGLVAMGVRYYSAALGRFISMDPSNLIGGTNFYEYTNDDPTALVDPNGLAPVSFSKRLLNYVLGQDADSINENVIGDDFAKFSSPFISSGIGALLKVGDSVTFSTLPNLIGQFLAGKAVTLTPMRLLTALEYGSGIGEIVTTPIAGFQLGAAGFEALLRNPGFAAWFNSFMNNHPTIANFLSSIYENTPSLPDIRKIIAGALGCPHFTTFDGLNFDFQGAGEFIAAKATQAGNTFQVQLRIEPEDGIDSSVSIITQIAVQVGADRVTFDADRADDNGIAFGKPISNPGDDQVVWVNGAPSTLSASNPILTLPGGIVDEVSRYEYRVLLDTGEVVTVDPYGDGMGFTVALAASEGPGSVQGFLGPDEGQANDFQLPNGTVLQQPLTQDELYQTFANAWRVTDATSLLDYKSGQDTATFTDAMYPREILTLADLPPDLVAKAAAVVSAAGITDPTLAADAEFDYITMGDPGFIAEDEAIADLAPTVVSGSTAATVTAPVTPPPSAGVLAITPEIVEAGGGAATPVTFDVNLTNSVTSDTDLDYTVMPGAGFAGGKVYFDAADFGGTLPSGSVTIPAGETEIAVTIDVPATALGAAPDKWLMLGISPTDGTLVYDPTAQTDILNNQPVAGTQAAPTIELLAGSATTHGPTLSVSGTNYTLDLGQVYLNQSLPALQFALANMVAPGGDDLSSEITGTTGSGFQVAGSEPGTIGAGSAFQDLYLTPDTSSTGAHTETLTLAASDVNDTGYSSNLPNLSLTVEESVVACFAAGTLIETADGPVSVEALRVGDRIRLARGTGTAPVIWIGHRRIDCTRYPEPAKVWPVRVAAGAFGDGCPTRDLWLSPDHAVFVDDVLIPVRYLINRTSIVQEPVDAVSYFHVELPAHEVLLAEGMPRESYLDTGNRGVFGNGGGAVMLHPDPATRICQRKVCAELLLGGSKSAVTRLQPRDGATQLGFATTADPGVRLRLGRRLLAPEQCGTGLRFLVPPGTRSVWLLSRACIHPDRLSGELERPQGIAVATLLLDRRAIDLADTCLDAGWYAPEDGVRYTNGTARIKLHGAREILLALAPSGPYLAKQQGRARSSRAKLRAEPERVRRIS